MVEKSESFKVIHQGENLGHSVVIGRTGSGKTVSADLIDLWSTGHPGGIVSIAQASIERVKVPPNSNV